MSNQIKLTFAGDADSLAKASKQAEKSVTVVGDAADRSGKQMAEAAEKSTKMGDRMGHLGSAVTGAGDALDMVGGSLQAVVDLQNASADRAMRLSRAINDVEQAQVDYNQALRDSKQSVLDADQAMLDMEQANIDAGVALKDYNEAVKEHGKNSLEAKQAALDLKQAKADLKQAEEDHAQAMLDGVQATVDAKSAQLDLNEASREANPTELSKWAENLGLITPLMGAIVGVMGMVTAAQWLWNASLFASPITWIVIGIVALVAVIVLIATKTTWFQDIWKATWGGIKKAASAVWDWIKDTLWPGIKGTFEKIGSAIYAPFRWAFNQVSNAWNATVGKLSWSVPSWIPGIGGNTISVPKLPKYHTGGVVSGAFGAETMAVLRAGERVTPTGGGSTGMVIEIRSGGSRVDDLLVEILSDAIRARGGSVQHVLGS